MKKRIGGYCELLTGFPFKSENFNSDGRGIPLIRIRDLSRNKTETYYEGDFNEIYLVKNGDLLIGMDGEFNISQWMGGKALLNQRIAKIYNFSTKLIPKYIYYLIKKELKLIEDKTSFVTVKHISSKQILNIEIPLISLDKQQKIIKILDLANYIITKRMKNNNLLSNSPINIFLNMFGDPDVNPKKWDILKLSELTICLDSQRIPITKSDRKKGIYPYYGANGIADYTDKYIFDDNLILLAEDASDWGKFKKCSFRIDGKTWVNNHAHVLKANEKSTNEYLEWFFNISDLTKYITGSTRGKLTKSKMNEILVPIPSIELQKKFSSIIKILDDLKLKQDKALIDTNRLIFGAEHKVSQIVNR